MSTGTWVAPGRLNLIGEHTDHSEGFVLTLALPQQTSVTAVHSPGRSTFVQSTYDPDHTVTFRTADVEPGDVAGWGAYVAGVTWALRSAGYDVGSLGLIIDSTVPADAGLASSVALQCAVAMTYNDMFGLGLSGTDLARIAQRAETDFVGVASGFADQMASLHGQAGHALFVDARSFDTEHVPLDLARHGLALIVVDTGVESEYAHSAYAERRAECDEAAKALGVTALRDASLDMLDGLSEPIAMRARHVITENARVTEVVDMLRSGADPREMGPLLTEAHVSLRDDFGVSVPETDIAVHALLGAGAYGARITGGGFSGSVLGLVETRDAGMAMGAVKHAFDRCGFDDPAAFVAGPSHGATRVA